MQRALRSRVERRDALLEVVRTVNTTLDPGRLAELIVDRAATWVPAPCWAMHARTLCFGPAKERAHVSGEGLEGLPAGIVDVPVRVGRGAALRNALY